MTNELPTAGIAATPEGVAFRVLERLFPEERDHHDSRRQRYDDTDELLAFQERAIARARYALGKWRFVLLCDDVGLGKTHMGVALLRRARHAGLPVVLVVPSALRAQWTSRLRTLRHDRQFHLLTHTALSRGSYPDALVSQPGLIIVDEAHAFRSEHAKRHAALSRLAHRRDVCLITATPINNSVFDLYSLLRIALADDAFASIGIPSLHSVFTDIDSTKTVPSVFRTMMREIMIRRTRKDVEFEVQEATSALKFPRLAAPLPVRFNPNGGISGSHRAILHEIESLSFESIASGSAGLLRYLLLKRLASSPAALAATTRRLLDYHSEFIEALDEGLLVRPHDRALLGHDTRSRQLMLRPLVLRPLRPGDDRAGLRLQAQADMNRLRTIHRWLHRTSRLPDDKLRVLRELVFRTLAGERVLIFSEFRETAVYLWERLRNAGGVGMVHGGGAWLGAARSTRSAVVHRFAPDANKVRPRHKREHVRLLIATDVLAEGLNLQDCAHVISYDLPWNPVRIRQRVGRVNRMGSSHSTVFAYNFLPDRDLEKCLSIVARLRVKSDAIARTIGDDEPVFADGAVSTAARSVELDFRQEERLRRWIRTAPMPSWSSDGEIVPIAVLQDIGDHRNCRVCLFIEETADRRARLRAFEARGARVVESDPGAAVWEILNRRRAPLDTPSALPTAGAIVARAAARVLDRLGRGDFEPSIQRLSSSASCPRGMLARNIFAAASAIPGGPDDVQAARAEALIAALDRPLPTHHEHAVRRILRDGETSFDTLTARAAEVLAEHSLDPPLPPDSTPIRRVIAAVLLSPRRLTHVAGSAKIPCSK